MHCLAFNQKLLSTPEARTTGRGDRNRPRGDPETGIFIMDLEILREFPGGLVDKDLVLSLPWLRFDPWPKTCACHGHGQKKVWGSSRRGAVVNESD